MDPQSITPEHVHHFIRHALGFFFICYLVGVFIVIVPLWQTARKAGLNGAISLLSFIPLGALLALYIIAFSQWKSTPQS
jgi:ABC-type proline/glycine betaine transport system permease subunit